jgi:hypothetical protein
MSHFPTLDVKVDKVSAEAAEAEARERAASDG